MSSELPLAGKRIAMLVYNDVSSDARVIKTAGALSEAGAEVRVIALAIAGGRYAPGLDRSRPAFETLRVPIVEIRHLLPIWGSAARRLIRRTRGAALPPAAPPAAASETTRAPAATGAPAVTASAVTASTTLPPAHSGPKAIIIDLWARLDLTLRMASYWRRAARATIEWKPDAIHANDANTLAPASRAARRLAVPFIYDSHELWLHRNVRTDRPFARRWERLVERRGIARAAAVVTVSPSIADWLQTRYRLSDRPILLRNIPAASPTAGERARGRLRELAALSDDAHVLVYCGGITSNRGLERAVDALPHLSERHHLVAVGPAAQVVAAQLRRRAQEHGVSDRFHLVGSVGTHEVTTALSDGDVSLVLTQPTCLSYRFSLPNKLFESLHAGLPIIANDLPDTAAIVRESGSGTIVSVDGSAEELAAAVRATLARRAELSAAARAAADGLRWETDVATLVESYGDAMRVRATGRARS